LSGDEAVDWFTTIWDNYGSHAFFSNYRTKKGREWADEDLKSALVMLTRKRTPGAAANVSGFRKLQPIRQYHTDSTEASFEADIVDDLRNGRIVIIDLSQGDPAVQGTYAERLCRKIFDDGMQRFIANEPANYIQLYFEEAHNLFPKKTEADLKHIYNRLAKEGAKLRLGVIYATQEVSSIAANILKNTQNWFVSHLNNQDELKEVGKYYDFEDFVESLRMVADRGFIRMKTFSNAFTVPVQIDRFLANRENL
jgi:DNA helicase HerA-like ATPase